MAATVSIRWKPSTLCDVGRRKDECLLATAISDSSLKEPPPLFCRSVAVFGSGPESSCLISCNVDLRTWRLASSR
jgi:hypothetical protein